MNRRNFIKAFSTVTASIPIANALAGVKGTDEVISTFKQDFFIPDNNITTLSYVKETEFGEQPNDNIPIVDFDLREIGIYPWGCLVLAYNAKAAHYFGQLLIDKISQFNISSIVYVHKREQLRGLSRGMKVIGVRDYWKHGNHDDIMEEIYAREIDIISNRKVFAHTHILEV